MGLGKDLKPRKKRAYKPRNSLVVVNGEKRFICKNHGIVSEKDIKINKHSGSRAYSACGICLKISYAKYNQSIKRRKRSELSEEEKITLRKAEAIRRIKNKSLEKQRIRERNNSKELNDLYIKNLIRQRLGLSAKDISLPLIETYRVLVKIKRIRYKRI